MDHHPTNHRRPALLSALALSALLAGPAQADIFKSAGKAVKKGTKTVSSGVTKTADKVVDGTTKTADKVADGVSDAASAVVDGTRGVLRGSEIKAVTSAAEKSYTATAKAGESAYRSTVSAVQAGLDAAKQAALRLAAEAYLKKYQGFLRQLRGNLDVLASDDKAQVVLNRLVKASSERRLDDQTRADLLYIGERLGLQEWSKGSIVPGSSGGAYRSSWGLVVAGGGGYGVGAEGSFGLIANCYKEPDQRYGAGLSASVGGVAGLVVGGSLNITFFWQPGGVADGEGGYIGLGVEGAAGGIGGTIGVQWSLSEGMKGAAAGVPGFYLGYAAGVKVKAGALQGGYTWVPVKSTK